MDDRSDVAQRTILVAVTGMGTGIEVPVDANVPSPPDGCESRQILDHGALLGVMTHPNMRIDLRLRAVGAYAAIWGIEMERLSVEDWKVAVAAQRL